MTSEPTYAALRAYRSAVAAMMADPDCTGDLLLVGVALAEAVHLDADKKIGTAAIGRSVYGKHRHPPTLASTGAGSYPRADHRAAWRVLDVLRSDIRRYQPPGFTVGQSCARPMLRREGTCGRSAHRTATVVDPVDGTRTAIAVCSQPRCVAWLGALRERNRSELAEHPAPVPAANTGGVLERHLPEVDWVGLWRHIDPSWTIPPEGEPRERPRFRLLVTADPEETESPRPDLVKIDGGWR